MKETVVDSELLMTLSAVASTVRVATSVLSVSSATALPVAEAGLPSPSVKLSAEVMLPSVSECRLAL